VTPIALVRYRGADGRPRLGITDGLDRGVVSVEARTIPEWLDSLGDDRPEAVLEQARGLLAGAPRQPVAPDQLLIPVEATEVWAAGVTYERSREARRLETSARDDIYDRVYTAARPELFFKAAAGRAVGPGEAVGLRRDAVWHVPEPELTVLLDHRGRLFGYTLGNDMTARDLEAANPLYLPQAKMFHASAALGPSVVLAGTVELDRLTIALTVTRHGETVMTGETSVARLRRAPEELVAYLAREQPLAPWTALMTGTGIVPPDEFALEDGDIIAIHADPIGTLTNVARRIAPSWASVPSPEPRVLRVHPRDNVLVCLGALSAGFRLALDTGETLTVAEPIPFGHKIASRAIRRGEAVVKYGEVIGTASRPIEPGQHVHVHNMDSNRGRGDLLSRSGSVEGGRPDA
jgi:2-dehydro-3-deoxy-D-arabinonate dehydratase